MGITSTILTEIGKWAATHWLLATWRRMTSHPIFYPNRAVLDRESPLADKMGEAERIDAIWLTGIKSLVEIEDVKKVDRLLLPDPNSKSLAYYQSTMKIEERRDLGDEIRKASKLARAKRIRVRWLKESIGYSLTIWNPRGDKARVIIEMTLPVVHGGNHPSFEFRKPKHSETIDGVISMFDSLWGDEHSREPQDSEFDYGAR